MVNLLNWWRSKFDQWLESQERLRKTVLQFVDIMDA